MSVPGTFPEHTGRSSACRPRPGSHPVCQNHAMSTQECQHGLVQRNKYGTDMRDGLEICRDCGLPTSESVAAVAASMPRQPSTLPEMARAARERGEVFFEAQLDVSVSARDVSLFSGDSGSRSASSHARSLAQIESEGWRLEHAGYVFVSTGQSTRAKMLGTGESVAVSGVTVGIYLFRAATLTTDAP